VDSRASRCDCAVDNVLMSVGGNMVQKVTQPIDVAFSINSIRREAAQIYAAYFAGAPVHNELENAERRLLEILTSIYRKGRVPG